MDAFRYRRFLSSSPPVWLCQLAALGPVALVLFFAFFLLIRDDATAAPWRPADEGQGGATVDHWHISNEDFLAASFPMNAGGFSVTRSGDVLKTIDGGQNWEVLTRFPGEPRSIWFLDDLKGWVAGTEGTILHTLDGGRSWTVSRIEGGKGLWAIRFQDSNTGWVIGDGGTLARTRDGGKTWLPTSQITDANLRSISYASGIVWIAGTEGTVLQSIDRGATWQKLSVGEPVDLFAVDFVSDREGVAVGALGRAFHTSDSGRTWSAITLNREVTLLSVLMPSGRPSWTEGAPALVSGTSGYIYKLSKDSTGALAFEPILANTYSSLRQIVTNSLSTWVVGSEGAVLQSTNRETWRAVKGRASTQSPLVAIHWKNENHGWIVAAEGLLLRTTDKGAIWKSVPLPWPDTIPIVSRKLSSISFVDDSGWAVGNGIIFSTTDGGERWSYTAIDSRFSLLSVHAVSAKIAWAVGTNGAVFQTTNGTTWNKISVGENGSLTSVFFLNENRGWIVGAGGIILTTANGTGWRRRHRQSGVELRSVFFFDENHGWATGTKGTVLFSSDGEKWSQIDRLGPKTNLNAVKFVSPEVGWIVSDRSRLYSSVSGGRTWEVRTLATERSPPLNAVAFLNSEFGWVVGDGVIAKYIPWILPPILEFEAISRNSTVQLKGKVAEHSRSVRVNRIEWSLEGQHQYRPIPLTNVSVSNGAFSHSWNPQENGLRDGSVLTYRLTLSDGVHQYTKTIGQGFAYNSWLGKFQADYPYFFPFAIVLMALASILMVPQVLVPVYSRLPWAAAATTWGDTSAGKIVRALATLVVLPYFFRLPWVVRYISSRYARGELSLEMFGAEIRADLLKRSLILEAWVQRHLGRARIRHQQTMEQVSKNGLYVAMPVVVSGNLLDSPAAQDFGWLARASTGSLNIVGPGGSGKTTFSCQLGLWATSGLILGDRLHFMVPVVIRQPTTNIVEAITHYLSRYVAEQSDLGVGVVESLISGGRLLIIADGVSEWPDDAREHLIAYSGRLPNLVVTSRRDIQLDRSVVKITIGTIDQPAVFRFRKKYIQALGIFVAKDVEETIDHGLVDMMNHWFEKPETTCLLVRMYIDDAIASAALPSDRLAVNAPDVILRYVIRLTGAGENDTLLVVAKLVARASLTSDFAPQTVPRLTAIRKLSEEMNIQLAEEGLGRLVSSGLLEQHQNLAAGSPDIGFTFDPVAEFLAAIRYCEEHRDQAAESWARLCARLETAGETAAGFVSALRICLTSYRKQLRLPEFMRFSISPQGNFEKTG